MNEKATVYEHSNQPKWFSLKQDNINLKPSVSNQLLEATKVIKSSRAIGSGIKHLTTIVQNKWHEFSIQKKLTKCYELFYFLRLSFRNMLNFGWGGVLPINAEWLNNLNE